MSFTGRDAGRINSRVSVNNTNNNSAQGPVFPNASDNLVVFRVTKNTPGEASFYSQATVWLNPTSSDLSDLATGLSVFATSTLSSVSHLGLRVNRGDAFALGGDNIRVGTTFADVVPSAIPEPSSFGALAGVAMLGIAACRRRRG